MTLSCIAVIIIFGHSNVFFLPKNRRMEYFNEATIVSCLYHCYLFTDFVPSPVDRYTMGYSMIAFTMLNFVVNCSVMLLETI